MKLNTLDTSVEKHGLEEDTTIFSIDKSSEAMILEVLRSRIYSNPIRTVVAEYMNNARDSHTEAGKPDVPIKVGLPTKEELNFTVQDFGVGISPERIASIFTKFGKSTKRESNSQVGAYGLGSKSAFSLVDSFSVTTVYEGIKYYYATYIDETKKGALSLLDKQPTEEPNGTLISIPVKEEWLSPFENEYRFVTEYWSVKPQCNKKVVYEQKNVLIHKPYDYILEEGRWGGKAVALVGEMPFVINASAINSLSYNQRQFLGLNFVIYFAIGELSIAVSRDNLQYDEATQQAIKNKLNDIIFSIRGEARKAANEQASYVDAYLLIQKFPREVKEEVSFTYKVGNKEEFIKNFSSSFEFNIYKRDSTDSPARKKGTTSQITPGYSSAIIINDTGKKCSRSMGDLMSNLDVRTLFYLDELSLKSSFEDLLERYPVLGPDFLNAQRLSEVIANLPRKTRKVGGAVVKGRGDIIAYQLNNRCTGSTKTVYNHSVKVSIPLSQGGIYFKIEGLTNTEDGAEHNLCNFYNLFTGDTTKLQSVLGCLNGQKLYGVKAKDVTKLGSNWIHLNDAVNQAIITLFKAKPILAHTNVEFMINALLSIRDSYEWLNYNKSNLMWWVSQLTKSNASLDKLGDNLVRRLFQATRRAELDYTYYTKGIGVASLYTFKTPREKDTSYEKLYKEVENKYPMINMIIERRSLEYLFHYVELIDTVNEICKD